VRLTDLEAAFLKIVDGCGTTFRHVDILFPEADGIFFLCPVCFVTNQGRVGTHGIICWKPHVPQTMPPGPGRWDFQGTGLQDLTLVAGSSSILLKGGCNAHFFIRNGEIC
jgi:hypothetical protein